MSTTATHTTHNHFTALLEYVRDHPGEQSVFFEPVSNMLISRRMHQAVKQLLPPVGTGSSGCNSSNCCATTAKLASIAGEPHSVTVSRAIWHGLGNMQQWCVPSSRWEFCAIWKIASMPDPASMLPRNMALDSITVCQAVQTMQVGLSIWPCYWQSGESLHRECTATPNSNIWFQTGL